MTKTNKAEESFELPSAISAEDELDFSEAGVQAQRAVFQIRDARVDTVQNGSQAVFMLAAVNPEVLAFPVRISAWLRYTGDLRPDAKAHPEQIGHSTMKSINNAVYGSPRGSIAGTQGRYLSAWLKEGKDGRAQVGSFQPLTDAELEQVRDLSEIASQIDV